MGGVAAHTRSRSRTTWPGGRAGRLLLDADAGSLYDPAVQSRVQAGVGATQLSWFVSPPYVALLFSPFGALPYPVSALAWTIVSMALLGWSARTVATVDPRFGALGRPVGMVVAASCQPLLELVGGGQDTALVLTALVGGAALMSSGRCGFAGVLLGLTVVKPQLAVLVPVALVLWRAWRSLAGFVLTVVVAALAATLALGTGTWLDWQSALSSPLYAVDVQQLQAWKNSTLYGLVQSLVPDAWPVVAFAGWLVAAGVVVLLSLSSWDRIRRTPLAIVLLVTVPLVTVLVTPHAMVYDLVVALPAVAYLCAGRGAVRARAFAALAYVLLFLAPVLHLVGVALPGLAALGAPWAVLPFIALWREHLRGTPDAIDPRDAPGRAVTAS